VVRRVAIGQGVRMIDRMARRGVVGLAALALIALPLREAGAGGHGGGGGHGGFHGGFHHGGFHGAFVGFGFGFGFPGCCWWGAPYAGYYYPGYAYPPAAYPAPATYVSPTSYGPAVAGAGAPPPDTQDCHDYETMVTIAGRPERAHGVVCRQADGTWRLGAAR
jgi:hypothetical protein